MIALSASWSTAGCAAHWGDAAVVGPWTLYQRYGTLDLLARQYRVMRR